MTMRWVIVYGDYTTYNDSDGPAWEAPTTNVQVVLLPDPDHGWEALYGAQGFYIYIPGEDTWRLAEDWFALHDYLCQPGAKRVLFGRSLSREEWQRVRRWALDEVGPKHGWWPDERR